MGFTDRDIRQTMDVYTLDNALIGQVLAIEPGPARPEPACPALEDARLSHPHGEATGPVPTERLGNFGPATQPAAGLSQIAVGPARPLGRGRIRVGTWWGLRGSRLISTDDILTVSLERVVLKHRRADLPARSAG